MDMLIAIGNNQTRVESGLRGTEKKRSRDDDGEIDLRHHGVDKHADVFNHGWIRPVADGTLYCT